MTNSGHETGPSSAPRLTRRDFHRLGLAAGVTLVPGSIRGRRRHGGGKLNLGIIGVGGRGSSNRAGVESENIVAVCDVDGRLLEQAAKAYPGSSSYRDFRELLRRRDLDAVVISTPDHTHAPATVGALRRGLDVYCEKPLAHTIGEVRLMTDLARQRHAVTQMGIQIHALPNFRRVIEQLRAGAIGDVTEAHVFVNGTDWSFQGLPQSTAAVPDWLSWDLWLGPAPERAYHPKAYHPVQWRRHWDFGGGTTGDMGCHYMDLAFWALGLTAPERVRPGQVPGDNDQAGDVDAGPPVGLVAHYDFPAIDEREAVKLTWYGGKARPPIFSTSELGADSAEVEAVSKRWTNGVLFCGSKGYLMAGYTKHELLPAAKFVDHQPPQASIADSVGHHREWIEACHSREATSCGFDYAGPLTEAVLLANVAFRAGKPIEWDAARATIRNEPGARRLLHKAYRKGWTPADW